MIADLLSEVLRWVKVKIFFVVLFFPRGLFSFSVIFHLFIIIITSALTSVSQAAVIFLVGGVLACRIKFMIFVDV